MRESIEFFTDDELKCPETGVVLLDPHFDRALRIFRETTGIPFVPNSCCRSARYNASIGGASRSYHLYEGINDGRQGTLAIDIPVQNDNQRAIMVKDALNLGWSVGVYKTFIHIDRRADLGKKQILFWGKY